VTVGEQLELPLDDVRPPWQGRSPRELTKCRLRFASLERKIGGTGRAHQSDSGAENKGGPEGGLLQYHLFKEDDHASKGTLRAGSRTEEGGR